MRKLFYPAIFHIAEEGGFWVTFPDFPECMTQGDDMQEAYEMAVDALGLELVTLKQEKRKIPKPSELHQVTVDEKSDRETIVVLSIDV